MTGLIEKSCNPLDRSSQPLALEESKSLLMQTPHWEIAENDKSISRIFKFKNYYQTMAFVNAVAWIAHQEDHHPDMNVGYNKLMIAYSTHSVGGLSENDFICAAKIDRLA